MPFVKVHIPSEIDKSACSSMCKEIRQSLVNVLGISEDHGHVVAYESETTHRNVHESRDRNFVFVEILMFSGRTDEMKEKLFQRISDIVSRYTGVNEQEIILNIIESDRNNWAARGGVPFSRVDLEY